MKPAVDPPPSPPSIDELLLPRLSDDAAVEIRRFLECLFDLFEARYGHQITRFYESLSRDSLVGPDSNFDSADPPF